MIKPSALVVNLYDVDRDDAHAVGEKAANLGELIASDFPVPPGFVITARSFYEFLKHNNLEKKIEHLIGTINFQSAESVAQVSGHIKRLILGSEIPQKIVNALFDEYERMGLNTFVAVRLSGEGFDMNEAMLNVRGEAHLAEKIKEAWALHFSPDLLARRVDFSGQSHPAIIVEKMILPLVSGEATSIDTKTGDKTKMIITADRDRYEVEKKDLEISKKVLQNRQRLTDQEIYALSKVLLKIEKHYYFPQTIDWAKEDHGIYVLRIRPVTTVGIQNSNTIEQKLSQSRTILVGNPVRSGIAVGPVRKVFSMSDLSKISTGDVLVVKSFDSSLNSVLMRASAIIVEEGMGSSNAAAFIRNLDIPAVVAAPLALRILTDGQIVTVNGKLGEIYRGGFVSSKVKSDNNALKTATRVTAKIITLTGDIENFSPGFDGVGLLSAENLILKSGIHPKKFLKDGRSGELSEMLEKYLIQVARAFYPKPVFYKTLDLTTDLYRGLIGGKSLEHEETNPMIGYRGAFRYIRDPKIFKIEIDTLKRVREDHGLNNLNLAIPFVRSVPELETVKKYAGLRGLKRSGTFKIALHAEVPANIILAEKFAASGIDEISIGLRSLTGLLNGADLSEPEIAEEFGVRSDAILTAIQNIVSACRNNQISVSVVYDIPSLSPSFVESLVNLGIDGISIDVSMLDQVRRIVYSAEEKFINKDKYV